MAKTRITTFALILNSRPNRFGKYAIYIRIIQDRKVTKVKTSVEVSKKDWNPEGGKHENWVRQSDPDYSCKNDTLKAELDKIKKAYDQLKKTSVATPERIISAVNAGESSSTFLKIDTGKAETTMTGFAAERTQAILDAGGIRNWKKYNGFLNKLADFMAKKLRKKEVLFADITLEFLTKFNSYLHTLHNSRSKKEAGKMLHQNTIVVVLNIFKTLVRKGMELGYITPDKNPFLTFKYGGVKTEKEKLDVFEIQALEALELEEDSLDWHSRNAFLFSFYCAGIRIGDLLQLRWLNVEGGRLNYQMGKNHKTRDLKLMPQAAAILDFYRTETSKPTDYIFPFMDNHKTYAGAISQADRDTLPSDMKKKLFEEISAKNALINKSLKRLAEKAGISKNVSMHISRHSFASVAAQKGIESNKVKSLLAHSRLQTTENYMGNFDTSENDKALESVFISPADKKAQLLALIQGMSEEDVASVLATLNDSTHLNAYSNERK